MNFVLSTLPLIMLIWLMVKRNSVSSFVALSVAAIMLYIIRICCFHEAHLLLHAGIIQGVLTAWTPILVIWGAIFLFRVLENSGALQTIKGYLRHITENKVAQLMIIGWAFSFLIEGASGFGTPTALCAPILVGLGFDPLKTVIFCLIMNSIPVSFGAVGTPTWFGLGDLGLESAALLSIGTKSALTHLAASSIIPILALRTMVRWQDIRQNIIFIALSIVSCMIPYTMLAFWNVEFPSLLGGSIGLVATIFLAQYQVGLPKTKKTQEKTVSAWECIKAFFPLWGIVLLLIITRVDFLPFKAWLNASTPFLDIPFLGLGILKISQNGVLELQGILGTSLDWKHALLYVPSFIPFLVIGILSFGVLKTPWKKQKCAYVESWRQIKKTMLTLTAALIFVKLMMVGALNAPVLILGHGLGVMLGGLWPGFAALLGALGAFFSGSNTVANLTFGGIQMSVAQNLGFETTTILALQNVGGAMGNMICISNIIAACAVVGIHRKEGFILKHTIKPMIVYGVIAAIFGFFVL